MRFIKYFIHKQPTNIPALIVATPKKDVHFQNLRLRIVIDLSNKTHEWINCTPAPKELESQFVKINQHSVIVIADGICYYYNCVCNEWKILVKIESLKDKIKTISINHCTNNVYILSIQNNKAIITSLNYKQFTKINTFKMANYLDNTCNVLSVCANSEYHLICTNNITKYSTKPIVSCHFVWNQRKNKLDKIHKFNSNHSNGQFIYITSQNILLLISLRNHEKEIWCYSLIVKKWSKWCVKNLQNRFFVSTKKIEWQITGSIINFSCVLTADERFVVIFGGESPRQIFDFYSTDFYNLVWLLDIKCQSFHQLKMKCPLKKCTRNLGRVIFNHINKPIYKAIVINNSYWSMILIFAYFGSCWVKTEKANMNILPDEIAHVILNMHGVDSLVHLFSQNGQAHYKMSIDAIIMTNKCVIY
eukprot:121645_1